MLLSTVVELVPLVLLVVGLVEDEVVAVLVVAVPVVAGPLVAVPLELVPPEVDVVELDELVPLVLVGVVVCVDEGSVTSGHEGVDALSVLPQAMTVKAIDAKPTPHAAREIAQK